MRSKLLPLEKDIEQKFIRLIKPLSLLVLKLNTAGRRSWPDRMVLTPFGKALFIEFKRPAVGRLSPGQTDLIADLRANNFDVLVSTDAGEALNWVKGMCSGEQKMESKA